MAFGDTRNAAFNRNIQRLLEYFLDQKLMKQQYGMMGEMETQRQAGYQALETKRQAGEKLAREETFRSSIDEIFARAKASVADQPGYTYAESMFNLAQQQGDEPGMKNSAEKMAKIMTPALKFYFKQQTGKEFTEEDIKAGLRAGGVAGVEKGIPERRTVSQFMEELPIKKMTAETQVGQLAQRKKEFEAEQGVGGKAGEKYYRNIHAKADGVLSYLQRKKEEGTPIDLTGVPKGEVLNKWIESLAAGPGGGLIGGALTPETTGDLMADISALDTKAMHQTLTPEEESKIDNAYDLFGYKAKLEQTPAIGIPSPTQGTAPSIVIPPNAPKAYNPTTGETAYWDGTRWIIIKNQ